MPKLTETIERLVTALTDDVIAAVRDVPLDELAIMTGASSAPEVPRPATRAAPERHVIRRRPPPAAPPKEPPAIYDESAALDAAQRFFEERGQRGATAPQLGEVLEAEGFAQASDASNVIDLLVSRGVVGDAGFRRTTGSGTAPVYIVTPPSQ